ncbi:MAG: MBL fold metallo-hydrolase [Pirellulales bacterium]|nr:MBL fold metallo-hydrolase [Pirellulales bacterium]
MKPRRGNRRDFLRTIGAGAVAAAGVGNVPFSRAGESKELPDAIEISKHLLVFPGPINVGILRDGDRALLVDCGDGRVAGGLGPLGIRTVERIVFTHHHRDQCCGAGGLAAAGAKLVVPEAERAYFDGVAAYWNDPKTRWHIYNFHPHHLMLAEPVPVGGAVKDNDEFAWGPARIRVLATPGHTDGSVSYLVEVDGRRVVFSGDLVYGEGQIWELSSMQKGLRWEGGGTSDYHGFLGSRGELAASLARIIRDLQPHALVPSHGRILKEPLKAIDALSARLAECHDKYTAISALRHYFPKAFAEYEGRKGHMPIRPGKSPPGCLRHFGTTWMLVSRSKAALVMDCGQPKIVRTVREMLDKGEIRSVDGLWITHYHDDHVDAVPEFQAAFDCPCITDRHVAEVITDPVAWRLPCISPSKARVDRPTEDGESWQWHEFRLTAYHLPGQTLYHSALFAEAGDLRMLFVGDSFTMGGIDDYCAQNRNWLGDNAGFANCVRLIEKLQPTHIFNCHVNDAFDFTPEQCRAMRENLAERERLFGRLFPWDHANYGMDESWVRCYPYEQKSAAGEEAAFDVVVTNHSRAANRASCRPALPKSWRSEGAAWTAADVPPKENGRLRIAFRIPGGIASGRYVIPVDLRYGPWDLPQFTEAVVVV